MRILRRILISLILLLLILGLAAWWYLYRSAPEYNGQLKISGLKSEVEVVFDLHGVPHVYANNEEDAYFALGYVHAQDRLFQMEMTRRLASGRLAEVLGSDLIKTDAFFRTLGLEEHASKSAQISFSADSLPFQKAALAYLKGLNAYVREGETPVEFSILGIDKTQFTVTDLLLTAEYMAFNFSMAMRTDPLMSFVKLKLGERYFRDLATGYVPGTMVIPVHTQDDTIPTASASIQRTTTGAKASVLDVLDHLPVSPFTGSNAWVLSPGRTKNGKVLFCNDTHIGFGQPSVWYEAHLVYPGMDFYGNYLAGFPFAALGHNPAMSWGLTMLENDDMDFFEEQVSKADSLFYLQDGQPIAFQDTVHFISVKNSENVKLNVRRTLRGPVVSSIMPEWSAVTDNPVSMQWTHLKFPLNLLEVTYAMAHSKNLDDFRGAVSGIVSPGLNVMYGDSSGNIAWWAAAKLVERSVNVHPLVMSAGSDSLNAICGYHPFEDNPHSENPSSGIVFNANNQPGAMPGQQLYPGYYVPEDRALRIAEVFNNNRSWTLGEISRIQLDHRSPVTPKVSESILAGISDNVKIKSALHSHIIQILKNWNGEHGLRDVGPVIYYKLVYQVLRLAMEDEMGEENFRRFLSTHVMKNSVLPLMNNDSSVWWNNVSTKEIVESRNMIFEKALDLTVEQLSRQLGSDPAKWEWSRVHLLEHNHPMGIKKPLNLLFNVGPFPIPGGPEVLCQMGFEMNQEGVYKVKYGPAMRINLDFADPEHSLSILPSGQSGNCMSAFYEDQADMYNTGKFRLQMMNRKEILYSSKGKFYFLPQ